MRQSTFFPSHGSAPKLTEDADAAAGLLSNTNTVQWQAAASWPLMGLFDHLFLSFQLGLVKPGPEVFEQVCGHLGADSNAVLFIDDNFLNVEGALQVGLQAVRARGVWGAPSSRRARRHRASTT